MQSQMNYYVFRVQTRDQNKHLINLYKNLEEPLIVYANSEQHLREILSSKYNKEVLLIYGENNQFN